MITASHNPAPDNGFKLMRGKASFFGTDIQALADRIEDEARRSAARPPRRRGAISPRTTSGRLHQGGARRVRAYPAPTSASWSTAATARPARSACARSRRSASRRTRSSATSTAASRTTTPTRPSPRTSRRSAPRVLATGAAARRRVGRRRRLGSAWSTSAARCSGGTSCSLLFARSLLARAPGAAVLGEVKCSETLYADIAARGGRPILWKTGHSLIKTKMKEEGALLAGEMSGHMFFADRWFGFDDAIYATVRLLEIVAPRRRRPSASCSPTCPRPSPPPRSASTAPMRSNT